MSTNSTANTQSPKGGIWSKLSAFQSKPSYDTFPELPDIITWVRIILGIAYGISLGLRNQIGFVGVLFGLNVVTFLPIIYINSYLCADADSYKHGLNFVGVPNAMAMCLLVWIVIFTHEHGEEENAFASAVAQKVAVTAGTEEAISGGDGESEPAAAVGGADGEETAALVDDTEF